MLYWFDKRQSQRKNKQRIPERVLLLFTLMGGALGAIYAQQRFRHKTQKRMFRVCNVLGVAMLATWIYGAWQYWL
nr:DUF1294 domain-containing protein [Marinomonas ostreistagni]